MCERFLRNYTSLRSGQRPAPTPRTLHQFPAALPNKQRLACRIVHARRHLHPIDLDNITGRLLLQAQDRNIRQRRVQPRISPLYSHIHRPQMRTERHNLRRFLHDTLPIVEIHHTLRTTASIQRDNQTPRTHPRIPRRHGRLLQRQHRPATNENRNMPQRRRNGRVLLLRHSNRRVCVPVIVNVRPLDEAGEHALNASGALHEDRRDEDGAAKEELAIRGGKARVGGELPGERAHDRLALLVRVPEQRVQVREQLEADLHGLLRRLRHRRPHVRLLAVRAEGVVVAVEGEEGAQLHPAVAELFVGVAVEAAGVDAEHGDAEEGEGEGLRDAEEHVVPFAGVVAAPVAGDGAGAGEGGAADDEGAFGGVDGEEALVGVLEDLVAEEVVHVVFLDAGVVGCVWGDGVDGQVALNVVDYVRWVIDISDTRCRGCSEVGGRCAGSRCFRRVAGGLG